MTSAKQLLVHSINTVSDKSVGLPLAVLTGGAAPTSGAWPAANTAFLVPFFVSEPMFVWQLYVVNGATVAGNVDIGLYSLDGSRLQSSGSTLQTGTNAPQMFGFSGGAAEVIGPGDYYLACSLSNITGTVFRNNPNVLICKEVGIAMVTGAFPLPSTISPMSTTAAFIPFIGIEGMGIE